jgi:hypothetical protein
MKRCDSLDTNPQEKDMKATPLFFIALCAGCATATDGERASLLAQPVNCETAKLDIEALEAAMPTKRERVRSAFQTVTPVGAVAGVVTGSYKDRAEILTGRTEAELAARVREVQATCGLVVIANQQK